MKKSYHSSADPTAEANATRGSEVCPALGKAAGLPTVMVCPSWLGGGLRSANYSRRPAQVNLSAPARCLVRAATLSPPERLSSSELDTPGRQIPDLQQHRPAT